MNGFLEEYKGQVKQDIVSKYEYKMKTVHNSKKEQKSKYIVVTHTKQTEYQNREVVKEAKLEGEQERT